MTGIPSSRLMPAVNSRKGAEGCPMEGITLARVWSLSIDPLMVLMKSMPSAT